MEQSLNKQPLGVGTVFEIDTEKASCLIRFDWLKTPRRIAVRAKLLQR